jgi:hypothetical protein
MLAKTPLSGGVFAGLGSLPRMAELTPWHISGTYLESCNCEVICPCRRIGGRPGGNSTYGECLGSLSWQIIEGVAGDMDLAGLRIVLPSATTTMSVQPHLRLRVGVEVLVLTDEGRFHIYP